MSNIIDIKSIEVQRINSRYRILRDEKLNKEKEIANLEKLLCEKKIEVVNISIKLRNLEELVLRGLK